MVSVEFAFCRFDAFGTAFSTVAADTVPHGAGSAFTTRPCCIGAARRRRAAPGRDGGPVRAAVAPPGAIRNTVTAATANATTPTSSTSSRFGRRAGAGGSGPAYGRWNGSTGR